MNHTLFDSDEGFLIQFFTLLVESTKEISVRLFIGLAWGPGLGAMHSMTENSAFRTTTQRTSHLTCFWIHHNSIFLLAEWMTENMLMLLVLWYLCHREKAAFYCVRSCLKWNYAISAAVLTSVCFRLIHWTEQQDSELRLSSGLFVDLDAWLQSLLGSRKWTMSVLALSVYQYC